MNTNNFIRIEGGTIKSCLDVVIYKQNGIVYAYSPALDLVGYDTNIAGAKQSFETVFHEYLQYAIENDTLQQDLEQHGWKTKKEKEYDSPGFLVVLKRNKQLQGVVSGNYTKMSRNFTYKFS